MITTANLKRYISEIYKIRTIGASATESTTTKRVAMLVMRERMITMRECGEIFGCSACYACVSIKKANEMIGIGDSLYKREYEEIKNILKDIE